MHTFTVSAGAVDASPVRVTIKCISFEYAARLKRPQRLAGHDRAIESPHIEQRVGDILYCQQRTSAHCASLHSLPRRRHRHPPHRDGVLRRRRLVLVPGRERGLDLRVAVVVVAQGNAVAGGAGHDGANNKQILLDLFWNSAILGCMSRTSLCCPCNALPQALILHLANTMEAPSLALSASTEDTVQPTPHHAEIRIEANADTGTLAAHATDSQPVVECGGRSSVWLTAASSTHWRANTASRLHTGAASIAALPAKGSSSTAPQRERIARFDRTLDASMR
ncbi:hypothetical protein PybrP1_010182 [[Pythium] brassicae (nom. inval.)]|nr:hypothetical protein PybrP1_010182 [[Pythium] brassicae (nom. inval.)]